MRLLLLAPFVAVAITAKTVVAFPSQSQGVRHNGLSLRHLSDYMRSLEDLSADRKSVATNGESTSPPVPEISNQGIYHIKSEEEYYTFLKANPDKLVIVKFFSSYCRACKQLNPKMMAVKQDKQLKGLPIVWADFESKRSNKDFFSKREIIALPTIHFYDGSRGLIENFPCPPTKIPLLKKKLATFLNSRVDPDTLKLKEIVESERGTAPRVMRELLDNELITDEHIDYLRNELPFFKDLNDEEFGTLLTKARLLTFNPGDVIIKQGMPGTIFYVVKTGVAEMSIKSRFDDPISTPPNYLGAVVSTLNELDYFGERALSTGEPYAASVRVLEKVRCFAFHVDDIPESCIFSKKRRATRDIVEQLSQRYELPDDYTPTYPVTPRDECVLELLVRFKQIRQAAKCFDYIMQSEPNWGDEGEMARRAVLVRKLTSAQRNEFKDVFNMVDSNHRGQISLLEMRKFMESARHAKTEAELVEMIDRANPVYRGRTSLGIRRDEFMGVMAEAEFYNLFKEMFQELDQDNTGYVRAGDLDEVLGGVRDLIADTRQTSYIDVDDKDMLVDYEQFSKMLLGAAL